MGVGAELCNQGVGYLTQGQRKQKLRMVCFLKVNLMGDLNTLSDEQR